MSATNIAIEWDKTGEHYYETGVDRGVLYKMKNDGTYENGEGWNGITSVDESPSGAEAEKIYADNAVYLNLLSAEDFGGTVNAYTYPDGFKECNGEANLGGAPGVVVGQQERKSFGFAYRTKKGNEANPDLGYLIHLWYGCKASPSDKSYSTVNDSPEAIEFSWEVTTTPVEVGAVNGINYKKTALITVDSTQFEAKGNTTDNAEKGNLAYLNAFEQYLYGSKVGEAEYAPVSITGESLPSGFEYYTKSGSTYSVATEYAANTQYYVKVQNAVATATPAKFPTPEQVFKLLTTGSPT